ncbi:hypothetical protein B0H11DRAFT_2376756 [Mycena galericulata]|nr:hypothetical protein B0H11DRAFT_2376756 [Mycena galericulata]
MFNSLIEIGHYFNSSANGISLRDLSTQIALYHLQPSDLICRYTTIGLHPMFLLEVESVVADIQKLVCDTSRRRECDMFVVDLDDTLLPLLRSSPTSLQVHTAWSMLSRRLFFATVLIQHFCLPISREEVDVKFSKFAGAEAEQWARKEAAEDRRVRAREQMVERVLEERQLAAARLRFLSFKVDSCSRSSSAKPPTVSRKREAAQQKPWRRSTLRTASNRALAAYYDFVPVTFAPASSSRICSPVDIASGRLDSSELSDLSPSRSAAHWDLARLSLERWVQEIDSRIHAQTEIIRRSFSDLTREREESSTWHLPYVRDEPSVHPELHDLEPHRGRPKRGAWKEKCSRCATPAPGITSVPRDFRRTQVPEEACGEETHRRKPRARQRHRSLEKTHTLVLAKKTVFLSFGFGYTCFFHHRRDIVPGSHVARVPSHRCSTFARLCVYCRNLAVEVCTCEKLERARAHAAAGIVEEINGVETAGLDAKL